jgi:predicted glutamine amidotransferase
MLLMAQPLKACRLWAAVSDSLPSTIIEEHLLTEPFSLEVLSQAHRNGWGLSFFEEGMHYLNRGLPPAYEDSLFDVAVDTLLQSRSQLALAHIRNCSSGLCDIPDPHPFSRDFLGKPWLLAHNGDIDKQVLLSLIDPLFLDSHPPHTGSSPEEWVDSELYFLYLLQELEISGGELLPALAEVVLQLRLRLPGEYAYLNILLTDGESLWAYREGVSLYWKQGGVETTPYTAVASRYPGETQEDWQALDNGELLELRAGQSPQLFQIEDYFDWSPAPPNLDTVQFRAWPNPGLSAPRLSFQLDRSQPLEITLHDPSGRLLKRIAKGEFARGEHVLEWQHGTLPAGVYLARLRLADRQITQKLVLLKGKP